MAKPMFQTEEHRDFTAQTFNDIRKGSVVESGTEVSYLMTFSGTNWNVDT
jgi:hypothetical protein